MTGGVLCVRCQTITNTNDTTHTEISRNCRSSSVCFGVDTFGHFGSGRDEGTIAHRRKTRESLSTSFEDDDKGDCGCNQSKR